MPSPSRSRIYPTSTTPTAELGQARVRRGEGTCGIVDDAASMRQQLFRELLDGLLDDAGLVRVALPQRRGEGLGLLERDVRRQRRNVRVGLHLEHDGRARRQRLVPGRGDLVRIVAEDALQAHQL